MPEQRDVSSLRLAVAIHTLWNDWFSSEYFLQALDRCSNRFVTHPRMPMPLFQTVPTYIFHFRTWFADVRDISTRRETTNRTETKLWFESAGCNASRLAELAAQGLVVSDSPGWADWLQFEFGLQSVPHPTSTGRASRSWNVAFPVKFAAGMRLPPRVYPSRLVSAY